MRRVPHLPWLVAIVTLCAALWYPRRWGALDLRYDAGVYYLLGTSIAEGNGYRIGSEPGAPLGIQYPPGLPLLAAAHQVVFGTSHPEVIGHYLRITFAGIFTLLGIGTFLLAVRYVPAAWAAVTSGLVLLQGHTIFLSDLFFADVPYAVVTLAFFLVLPARAGPREETGKLRTAAAGVLAGMAFLVRTAGIALLAAWVAEAVLRRRWRRAALLALFTLVPFGGWQAYTMSVKRSSEWARPAYEYQRAPYQFYNVSYLDNLVYVDPFTPELGRVSAAGLITRAVTNLSEIPLGVGEAVSVEHQWWRHQVDDADWTQPVKDVASVLIQAGLVLLTLLSLGGLVLLAVRGEWLIPLYVAASVALIVITPWPGQFSRYLMPLSPFIALGVTTALAWPWQQSREPGRRRGALALKAAAVAIPAFVLIQQAREARAFLTRHQHPAQYRDGSGTLQTNEIIFYTRAWRKHDEALDTLATIAPRDAIVATATPHWLNLHYGRLAVMPPFEPDPAEAQRLLDGVPVSYLVVDHLEFVDVGRRYTEPVVQAYPERWELLYSNGDSGSAIYRRVESLTGAK